MNLDKTKIRIKDEEHYELVQNALYNKGIEWCIGGMSSYNSYYEYLFINNNSISWGFYKQGISHSYKEITLEDILVCEIQYEIY
jgi:hypothetical protein